MLKIEMDEDEQTHLEKAMDNQDDSYYVIYKKRSKEDTIKDSIYMEKTTNKVNWIHAQGEEVQVLSVKKRINKTQVLTIIKIHLWCF